MAWREERGLYGFSEVTGGRPPSVSSRISGGSRSSELVEENAEPRSHERDMDTALKRPGREARNERKVP
jgi:hypothetical protein